MLFTFCSPLLYTVLMTDVSKFQSDIQRILKHDRQENSGKSDFMRVAADLQKLFARFTSCPETLANAVFEYWENEYIHTSSNLENEPSEENIEKLAAMLSFLENSEENYDTLTEDDWTELADIVRYEAEDLPMDTLQSLMSTLVSKGAY